MFKIRVQVDRTGKVVAVWELQETSDGKLWTLLNFGSEYTVERIG